MSLIVFCAGANCQLPMVAGDVQNVKEEKLNVFEQWMKWSNPSGYLYQQLKENANVHYDEREKSIAMLKSLDDWKTRQLYVASVLRDLMPKPIAAPVAVEITGQIKYKGYSIQKLIMEVFPGYYVTGCLYVPSNIKKSVPAVLHLMGHDQESFRAELYQLINANLAMKGMIVLTIDPPGQGERVQYFDAQSRFSSVGYSVIEHCYFGNQVFLSGISPATYFIQEAQRALDYLLSRKDVDSSRVGVMGFSGGGTIGSYLAAVDDRIRAAVLCSWSTASRWQMETKGTQDAETVLYGGLQKGLSFGDLLEVRAPRPTMLTFATRDQYLSIQGAREAYEEAITLYKLYDASANLQMVEDDGRHWITPLHRKNIYAFFAKYFSLPDNLVETKPEIQEIAALNITRTGQVSSAKSSRLIFDLHYEKVKALNKTLDSSRRHAKDYLNSVKQKAIQLSGYREVQTETRSVFFDGAYQRGSYRVCRYALLRENTPPVPFLLYIPDDSAKNRKAVIYLHAKGKSFESRDNIEALVRKGYLVAAADLIGTGETENGAYRNLSIGLTGVLSGTSVVGLRASEINAVAHYLRSRKDVDVRQVMAIGFKEICIPLIHAAAFDTAISSVELYDPQLSYTSLASNRIYKINDDTATNMHGDPDEIDFSWGVAGALTAYDLPDLMACIAPRKLTIFQPRDHLFKMMDIERAKKELWFVNSAYTDRNAQKNFIISDK